jgi:bromodomain-containing protein 7/9
VYAEPVDPEELPDYHDMIEHPMDFSTVRKKLANGSYSTLEELESDVLLICSNAMQYNSSDTVYYKQVNHVFIFSPIFFLC